MTETEYKKRTDDESIEEIRHKVVCAVIAHGWSMNELGWYQKRNKVISAERDHMFFQELDSDMVIKAYYSETKVGSKYISISNKDVQARVKL